MPKLLGTWKLGAGWVRVGVGEVGRTELEVRVQGVREWRRGSETEIAL